MGAPHLMAIWPPARHLDSVARDVAREWGLALGARFPLARYSYVAPADGAILKIIPPEDDEANETADALRLWDGDGAVRLLRHDRQRRALLLERAVPGHDASGPSDEEIIAVALSVGARLWRRAPADGYRRASERVPEWMDGVAHTGHPFVTLASKMLQEMDVRDAVLTHGDFHHHNLLRHGDRWVAIDPKPLVAEPEWDVVTLLWNPITMAPTRERTERRIALMVAGGLDEDRLRRWAIVRGTYLGLPLQPGEDEATVRQLVVVRHLLS